MILDKLSFVKNITKFIIGIISFILGITIRFLTPFYVESYMLLFLIPAIGLIIPHDYNRNSWILGGLTFVFVALVIYKSLNAYLDPYPIMSNLYLTGQINHLPTSTEISTFTNSNLIIILYSLYNIICGVLFFIPTSIQEENDPGH